MTAQNHQPRTTAAAHPLEAMLEQICAQAGGFLNARIGRPEGPDWYRATETANDGLGKIEKALERMSADLDTTDRRVMSSFFFKTYCNHILGLPIAGLLGLGIVPDVSAENVRIYLGASGGVEEIALERGRFATTPDGPGASHPDALVVADGEALRELFLEWIVDEHLQLVIEEIRPALFFGTRALWGTASDTNAGITIFVAERLGLGDRCEAEVEALLARPQFLSRAGVTLMDFGDRREHVMTRSVCCHAYRLPIYPNKCATCPLLSPEERFQRVRDGVH